MTDSSSRAQYAGISRRTINKTAAWSIPVIAAATAMPLAAASTQGIQFAVTTEPLNVPQDKQYGEMIISVTDDQGNPVTGGTLTLNVSGAGSIASGSTFTIVDGKVTVPAGTITRTAGDAIGDDIVVSGIYAPPSGGTQIVPLVTLLNREVVKLFHDQDSLATTGVDWTLESRPALKSSVFVDFFIRPRIEAGPRWSKSNPILATPIMPFEPKLQVKVTATNAHWGFGTTETRNDGLIDKHNGEHRLAYLYQDAVTGAVVVEGYADYATGLGDEKRRAHIRMTWPTAGRDSNMIDQWETLV